MRRKPRLSFWQVWNMSFGFLGVQFGFALQNANVSRIFETLGASIESIPILWIAAPITGLIVQPIVGYMSDKTWTKFGRRKPYFLAGALLASIALFIMPNSSSLWMAAGMLWILDASINISMEPFRAYVGDMLPNEQRMQGFAMQSFFIGLGAVAGSFLPYIMSHWLSIPNTAPENMIPPSVKFSFYIGGVIFFITVLWTVLSTKEYSPEQLESFEDIDQILENQSTLIDQRYHVQYKKYGTSAIILAFMGVAILLATFYYQLQKELFILGGLLLLFSILIVTAYYLNKNSYLKNGLVEIISDFFSIPKTMKQLAVVQFFTWTGLFAMWIYTTAAVTTHIYGTSDTLSKAYNDGADWVNVMFGVYNGVAALSSFAIPFVAKKTNRKITHAICLSLGALGLISIYLFSTPELLIISMVGVGIAWASILSMPYAILTGALPSDKMGVYMGIFNFFIVIPQILAATILGFLVKDLFNGESIFALVLGGLTMIIAAITVLFVDDKM